MPVCIAPDAQNQIAIVPDDAEGLILTWLDYRTGAADIYAQRLARHGNLGNPEPLIVSVTDVPNDQRGSVKVSWNASYFEWPYQDVTHYNVFRSVPPNVAARMRSGARVPSTAEASARTFDRPGDLLVTMYADTTYYWEYLTTVTGRQLTSYSQTAATGGDGNATAFMVQAHTGSVQHWESTPMTGASIDNLAPAPPAPFTGIYGGPSTHLQWGANTELDLANYRLYRGDASDFVPGTRT